jgi:hypothetical protein
LNFIIHTPKNDFIQTILSNLLTSNNTKPYKETKMLKKGLILSQKYNKKNNLINNKFF